MPSDELKGRALEALRDRIEAFRSAVAATVEEVRVLLAGQRQQAGGGERTAAELGGFAAGRIDHDRFAALFAGGETLDAAAVERVEAALETMAAVLEAGDDAFLCRVEPGADLRDVVRGALARTGRAFGAARAVEAVRQGTEPGTAFAAGLGPERWTRTERVVAPPLVIDVDGADLRPAALADWLEGGQAFVLLVRRPAPPAALARLVTPGTLIVQTTDAEGLDALHGWDGPAAMAVAPEGAAEFAYLPAGHPRGAGQQADAGTLTVTTLPEGGVRSLGALSAARQEADLALLRMLADAAAGRVASAAAPAGAAVDPADRLAAWLIRQAEIPTPGAA